MRQLAVRVAVMAAVLALGACAARGVRVADVQQSPGRYYERVVRLEGGVTEAWSVPVVPFRVYKIDDGTGEITVVAQSSRAPTRGSRVRVTGKVSELAVIGGRSVGLHIQEGRLEVLRPR